MVDPTQRCIRCILPAEYPGIVFDDSGLCNYCKKWDVKWQNINFEKQQSKLEDILSTYRNKTKPYDCLIGLSGGKDSCYAAFILKEKRMNPLGCTFDNGFMTTTTLENINSTVKALSIGHVYVKNRPGYLNQFYKHFVQTSGEFCSVCNVGIKATLYRIASSYGINLIVSGQSTRTEANSPQEYFTCSSGYFKNVAQSFFSNNDITKYLYIDQFRRIKSHIKKSPYYLQLPSYMPWKEEEFLKILNEKLNWKGVFGEQHVDCRMSDAKEYLKLEKFGVIELEAKLSSLVRDGQISRDEALKKIQKQVKQLKCKKTEIEKDIKKEFELSDSQLKLAMQNSHIPYLSKTDALLTWIKNFYERIRF